MKKKIYKILGVLLTAALLVGLFVTAAPVAAGTQSWSKFSIPSTTGMVLDPGNTFTGPLAINSDGTIIYAGAQGGYGSLITNGNGTASWSTAFAQVGNYSAMLSGGTQTGSDYTAVVIQINGALTLPQVTSFVYNYYFAVAGNYGPHICFYTHDPSDGETADITLYSGGAGPPVGTPAALGWNTVNVTGATPGFFWYGSETTFGGLTQGLPNVYTLGAFQAAGDFANHVVDRIQIEYGWWGAGDASQPAYVDDFTLNGVNHDLGPTKHLVKSIDGGRTWTPLTGFPVIAGFPGAIVDIVCSSIDPNTVYATDGYDIWRSDDAGVTWAPRTNLFTFAVADGWTTPPSGMITSIDIGYLAQGPHIFAGVGLTGSGGVYVCYEWQLGMPWDDMAVDINRPVSWGAGNASVLDVKVDPSNFVTTQMIMAVAENTATNRTYLTHHYDGAQWNSMEAADAQLMYNNVTQIGSAFRAQIWLPDGFNASLASGLMQYFVGLACGNPAAGDVYLVAGAAVPGPSPAFDLNIGGAATATHITGLDGEGGVATASMLASGYSSLAPTIPLVLSSQTGGATWTANLKRPTGGASGFTGTALSSVLVMPGYASTGEALVGTHGADCGVHITNDFGSSWNGISLLNTSISAINDLEPGSLFLATDDGVVTVASLWRHDGTNWERVLSTTVIGGALFNIVEASPAGDAVFVAHSAGAAIWRSIDNGQTWARLVSLVPGLIPSWLVIDASTVYVGGNGVVYQTTTNGVVWFTRTCAVGTVTSLAVDPTTGDLLAAGVSGAGVAMVARSQDGGITWTAITAAVPFTANVANNVIAEFSYAYASNQMILVTGTDVGDADAQLFRYDYDATVPAWQAIDNEFDGTDGADALPDSGASVDGAFVANGTGLVVAPGGPQGMVYVMDADGVSRFKCRDARTASQVMAELIATPTLPVAVTPMGLWYSAGSNQLWTIDTTAPGIWTYTDTLNVFGSGAAVSNITTTTATISWDDIPNASTYKVVVVVGSSAPSGVHAAASSAGIVITPNHAANTATVTVLAPVTTYSFRVWGLTPVSTFHIGGETTFTTLPTAPIYTPNLMPFDGAQGVIVENTPFAWDPVAGATSYLLQISTDSGFATILAEVPSDAEHLILGITLDYSSAYYWRVRAVTATGFSTWVTSIFTTEAEPVETVVVEEGAAPQITLTVPSPETPAYIWAIIVVGGILTLAVIVLIVRTRRVV